MAANFALRKIKNTEYLKNDEAINNKNSKVIWLNLAREDKIACSIYKKPGHTTGNFFHLSKSQEAILNKQQHFFYPNQLRYNNFNG